MNKQSTREDYARRISRVIDYIYAHLDEPLDNDKLAEVACLSPYHWHRIYHAMTQETAAESVRRLRLHRAAGDLVRKSADMPSVAKRAGYGSVEAFSRAFRAAYGMPPGSYRDHHVPRICTPTSGKDPTMLDVEPKNIPPMRLAGIAHKGSYMDIGRAFETLFAHAGAAGLLGPDLRMIGIYHDDPSTVPEAELRSEACLLLPNGATLGNASIREIEVRGGRYAVARYKGPYPEMMVAYNWLYGSWLPESGEEMADAPCIEEYLNNPREVAPTELLTNICMPLK